MINDKEFFSMSNWKQFNTKFQNLNASKFENLQKIEDQNKKGFIVIIDEIKQDGSIKYNFYKKHSTSILKQIIIGKFPLMEFSEFKSEIDKYKPQSELIKILFDKPEFLKYSIQKQMYFPN